MNRLLLIEPNLSEAGVGHFFELSRVLAEAASRRGIEPHLITARPLDGDIPDSLVASIRPVFSDRKIRKWSLGPHGHSREQRDLSAVPVGGSVLTRARQHVVDRLHGAVPRAVVERSSANLSAALTEFSPTENDTLVVTTCDDFTYLVVAAAVRQLRWDAFPRWVFHWHAPMQEGRPRPGTPRWPAMPAFREQMRRCDAVFASHPTRHVATTAELARQLDASLGESRWQAIDYPIDASFAPPRGISPDETCRPAQQHPAEQHPAEQHPAEQHPAEQHPAEQRWDAGGGDVADAPDPRHRVDRPLQPGRPRRVVLAGAVRPEQGKRSLSRVVDSLWDPYLRSGRWQLGLQTSVDKLKTVLPRRLRRCVDTGGLDPERGPFVLASSPMGESAYRDWVRQSDLTLFLYHAERYYTRCSGVLVEALACGVPVLVPAASWLSRQLAGPREVYLSRTFDEASDPSNHGNPPRTIHADPIRLADPPSERPGAVFELTKDETLVVRISVASADTESYLGVRVTREAVDGRRSELETHVLEVNADGRCHVALRGGQGGRICLSLFCPFGESGLSIEAIDGRRIPSLIATSAVGMVYCGHESISHRFDEITACYDHYRETAMRHAATWRAKHSSLRALDSLLGTSEFTESVSTPPEYSPRVSPPA